MSNPTMKSYEYHAWANGRVFARLAELSEETLHQELKDVFPSLYAGLVHIYQVDTVWLAAVQGRSYEEAKELRAKVQEKTTGKSIKELEALFLELAESYRNFLNEGGVPQLVRDFTHPTLGVLEASISELIQHVVNHGTYHRGNITSMLRQLGYTGVPTDYVLYLYEANK
ncbi:protein DinB [Paenibacillus marchantiophytorum]|uniref:Protein DinB n=1 Tax=Paenibacillus marchantiophytorum TaxID=1619310 RepID=A0ABQ1F3E7_9BACL|nr:DinB family protein [Paenibacillus marchantiophytorum]GFZ98274.1 protein DinB [Paenibacillus marchantiophytorum]